MTFRSYRQYARSSDALKADLFPLQIVLSKRAQIRGLAGTHSLILLLPPGAEMAGAEMAIAEMASAEMASAEMATYKCKNNRFSHAYIYELPFH